MTSHKNKAANDAARLRKGKLEARTAELTQEFNARNKATSLIYAYAEKWLGTPLTVGDSIPIMRDGKLVGSLTASVLSEPTEISRILSASQELKTPELKRRLKMLTSLKDDAEALRDKLASFDPFLLASAVHAGRGMHDDLEGRLVRALGADNAAYLGLEVISVGLVEQIVHLEVELEKRGPSTRGRAKDQAAIQVAIEAARFFAIVTGEMPTYGDGPDGLTGKFTPFLRELYDVFGWESRSLRPGLDAAIDSTSPADAYHARKGILASYLAYGLP